MCDRRCRFETVISCRCSALGSSLQQCGTYGKIDNSRIHIACPTSAAIPVTRSMIKCVLRFCRLYADILATFHHRSMSAVGNGKSKFDESQFSCRTAQKNARCASITKKLWKVSFSPPNSAKPSLRRRSRWSIIPSGTITSMRLLVY